MHQASPTIHFSLHGSERLRVAPVFELSEAQEAELTRRARCAFECSRVRMALRARIVLLAARCAAGEGGRAKAGGTDHAEQARGGHALTLRELASKAGISDDTARAVEAGNLQTGLGAYLAMLWAPYRWSRTSCRWHRAARRP